MALLGTINKQPGETLDADISYATVLQGRADTIVNVTSAVAPAGLVLESTTFTPNSAKVVFSGGTDAILYKITVTATSSAVPALVYEDEINVLVGEE